MRLGLLNLERKLAPIIHFQLKSGFNEISQDFLQDQLRETMSRAHTRGNHKHRESDGHRSECKSEINLITQRTKPRLSGFFDLAAADILSLPDPDNKSNLNTKRTMVSKDDMGNSQPLPRIGLKNSLVTKTQEHGRSS